MHPCMHTSLYSSNPNNSSVNFVEKKPALYCHNCSILHISVTGTVSVKNVMTVDVVVFWLHTVEWENHVG